MASFENCFWKFIKENVGISKVHTASTTSLRLQKSKKSISFEERYDRVTKMVQKAGLEDDKLDASDNALAQW